MPSNTIPIGSYSSGSCRPEDWRDALIEMLDCLRLTRAGRALVNEAKRTGDNDENLPELVDEMLTLANDYAPDYCYVGGHEYDPARLGCWPMVDSVQEAVRDGEILARDDSRGGRNDDIPRGYRGLLAHCSDHGDLTLYHISRGKWREVWAVV